jgi:hypothetical protein
MSSTNTYSDTTSADYLNDVRRHIAANKAKNTSQTNITPRYIFPVEDTINITDSVSVAPDAVSGTYQVAQDSINLTDVPSQTSANPAKYSMPEYGYITEQGASLYNGNQPFVSTASGGFMPEAPIVMGFWELGT